MRFAEQTAMRAVKTVRQMPDALGSLRGVSGSRLAHLRAGSGLLGGPGLLLGGSLVAGIEVSVLVSEAHSLSSTVTTLSLESGSQVSDHVIVEPAEVSVVFSMTNAGSGSDAARDVFETFKRLRDERALLELATEHHVYENMVITSLAPMHEAPYKGALSVSMTLRQISFARLETAGRDPDHTRPGTPASKTASEPVNAGRQDPKPVRLPEETREYFLKNIPGR